MASVYEIRELGFIGSLWRGKTDSPKNVGKTFEVRLLTDEPSLEGTVTPTLAQPQVDVTGANLSPNILGISQQERDAIRLRLANQQRFYTGGRTKLYFTDETDLDLVRLNKNLIDSDFTFEIGKLPSEVIEDYLVQMRVDSSFLKRRTVLYRFNKKQPKNITYSKLPIQSGWKFDTSDEMAIRYSNSFEDTAIYAEFVIPITYKELVNLTEVFVDSRFTLLETINTTENGGIDTPPYQTTSVNGVIGMNKFDLIDLSQIILGTPLELDPITGQRVVSTLTEPLGIDLTVDGEPKISVLPEKPEFVPVFSLPTDNEDELARKRALDLFILTKSSFNISNIDQFNSELNGVLYKIQNAVSIINDPFLSDKTAKFNALVQIKLNEFVKNYLYEQICIIEDVDIPERESERWSIDENGNIIILPRVNVLPRDLVSKAVDDKRNLDIFDSYIDELIDDLTIDDNSTYVFKKVSKVSDYSLPILRYKTNGLFRCTGEKLSTFYTGSLTTKQSKYYLTVFNEKQYTDESYHQFDITYCHISGSGSSLIENEVDLYPAKAMYRKYMLECFGHTNGKFPFKNGKNGDYFYVIQLDRNQYKEKLDAGNFELALCELTSSGTEASPTSTRFFTLIDESKDTKQEVVTDEGIQEYYYVTSGSLRDGVYNESTDDAWGVVFPKMGLIILDGVVLDQSCSFSTVTSSTDGQNSNRLFLAISGAAVPNAYRPSGSFFARSFETFLTETYFCRADFNEFNTSTNYTYTSGSGNFLKYDYFSKDPQSYITTVGLYNREKELLAIGKLRNPIRKNDGKVIIFEVVLRLN